MTSRDVIHVPKTYISPCDLFTFDQRGSSCLANHISPCTSQVFRTVLFIFIFSLSFISRRYTEHKDNADLVDFVYFSTFS